MRGKWPCYLSRFEDTLQYGPIFANELEWKKVKKQLKDEKWN